MKNKKNKLKGRKDNSVTKSLRVAVPLIILLSAAAAFAQTDAQKAYRILQTMPGTWEGTAEGKPLQVTFKETAGGSAILSEILGPEDMITMFHFDGPDRLLMTHYCAAGNQPRLRASLSPDGKVLTFDFVDATNLASPDAGHMQRVVFTLLDANHHVEEWTFLDHGKEIKRSFDLRRKG